MALRGSRTRSRSLSADSLCVNLDDWDEGPAVVRIELVPLDSAHVFRFEVHSDSSIGQVMSKFKMAAFAQFASHDFYESYKNGRIVLINEASSSPPRFDLSDEGMYTPLATKGIRQFRSDRPDAPLIFQLIRSRVS